MASSHDAVQGCPPEIGKHFGFRYDCKVEVSVRCTDLVNLDLFSKSDPMVVLYTMVPQVGSWQEHGRTEVVTDSLNPRFIKPFILDYKFQEVQPLKFVVYDVDNAYGLEEQDLIGQVKVNLAEIVGARGQAVTREIDYKNRMKGRKRGYFSVFCEELKASGGRADTVLMRLATKDVTKASKFSRVGDQYIVVSRRGPGGGGDVPVYRTESHRGASARFQHVTLRKDRLCHDDPQHEIVFEVWEWRLRTDHVLLGTATTTLEELTKGRRGLPLEQGGRRPGAVVVENFYEHSEATFLEYVRGGCDISLIVAIDFTASNKAPHHEDSLHRIDPKRPNMYDRAIMSVGKILAHYDSDKKFPVLGFGARTPPEYAVNHCFNLTFNPECPEVEGVDGILDAYHFAVDKILFSGPTVFSEAIQYASRRASTRVSQDNQKYFILLILTDGAVDIQDMPNTVDTIVAASGLPLSIVIGGVGKANFDYMRYLDSDDTLLTTSDEVKAKRDIVQFVNLSEFTNKTAGQLATHTLAEIPAQFLSYMQINGIKPNKPRRPDVMYLENGVQIPKLDLAPPGDRPRERPQYGDVRAVTRDEIRLQDQSDRLLARRVERSRRRTSLDGAGGRRRRTSLGDADPSCCGCFGPARPGAKYAAAARPKPPEGRGAGRKGHLARQESHESRRVGPAAGSKARRAPAAVGGGGVPGKGRGRPAAAGPAGHRARTRAQTWDGGSPPAVPRLLALPGVAA